ncbi:hypothetical protein LX97_00696 [Nonlabens dokdonensis]|jgi:hypothetical protein|uniref:Uncharacterized protein n=3 Tax=Nonlabens dokdonensis TaxID=328515 RepID=L7W747_NONDD|nr:hypothetical protein DDD_0895 [Nonlabens dokdonensis DSW-6]PZX43694.1 hypothetical protein LX97_00696 [Nonlabens dokdonensis]
MLLTAQNNSKSSFSNETIKRIHLLSPGFEIEQDLNKNLSFVGNFGFFPAFYSQGGSLNKRREGIVWAPFIDLQGRYYTNFNRRLDKGKSIENNSGNFIALKLTNYFPSENDEATTDALTIAGFVYGIQRTYWDHFHINLESGLMADLNAAQNDSFVLPWVSFQLGYTF